MAFIIPYFISHMGCPHQCLFCNQKAITFVSPSEDSIVDTLNSEIELWLTRNSKKQEVQLAFYGGSFTCLPQSTEEKYLKVVFNYIEDGLIDSIRLSTRPDCINDEICELLKGYGVKTVELGVQSMDDEVLKKSVRGHDSKDSESAIKKLKAYGFEVGVQLLPGLPGETSYSFISGVKKIIECSPKFVRLYPALVMKHSGLEKLYGQKKYKPLSLTKAVVWTGKAKILFESAQVQVIRMGLQHSESLEKELVAGPYHPAFGELVESRKWFRRTRKILLSCPADKKVTICISDKDLSAFNGPKKVNFKRLQQLNLAEKIELQLDSELSRGSLEYVIN